MEAILGTVTEMLGGLDIEAMLAEIDFAAIVETLKTALSKVMELFSSLM